MTSTKTVVFKLLVATLSGVACGLNILISHKKGFLEKAREYVQT